MPPLTLTKSRHLKTLLAGATSLPALQALSDTVDALDTAVLTESTGLVDVVDAHDELLNTETTGLVYVAADLVTRVTTLEGAP